MVNDRSAHYVSGARVLEVYVHVRVREIQRQLQGAAAYSHVDRFVLFVDKTLKRTISVPCDIDLVAYETIKHQIEVTCTVRGQLF